MLEGSMGSRGRLGGETAHRAQALQRGALGWIPATTWSPEHRQRYLCIQLGVLPVTYTPPQK